MTTEATLRNFPGLENLSSFILNFYLDRAFKDNDSDCWGACLDDAITLQAAAMALDSRNAAFGATGPTTSMSRSMGASGSLGFAAPPDNKAISWQRNIYGQQYVELRQRVFAGGAMAIRQSTANRFITTP